MSAENNNLYYDGSQGNQGSNPDGSEEQSDAEGADMNKPGGKRRSKNDNAGRDFKCKYCDKTYLSYPALYTHMKQKHSKGPDGEQRNPPTSGRGRGRPRKNPYQRLDPRTEDFFKAPEREGGPVDPLCCFKEVFECIFSQYIQQEKDGNIIDADKYKTQMYEYPIFKHLTQFSTLIDSEGKLTAQALQPTPAQYGTNLNKEDDSDAGEGDEGEDYDDEHDEVVDDDKEGGSAENEHEGSQNGFEGGEGEKPEQNALTNPTQQLPEGGAPLVPIQNGQNTGIPLSNQLNGNAPVMPQGGFSQGNAMGQNYGSQQTQPGGMAARPNYANPAAQMPVRPNGGPPGLAQQPLMGALGIGGQPPVTVSNLPAGAKPEKWQRYYDNLTDKDRQDMLVDEIFALYLYRMSNRINQNYYRTVLAYVIFFRECLNEYGWGKKIESEAIRLDNNPEMKLDIETKQFCLVNNAEHAPEICNEFVTVYMEYKKSLIDIPKHDQIDLTINLCHWLFECQFTCSKLTMVA